MESVSASCTCWWSPSLVCSLTSSCSTHTSLWPLAEILHNRAQMRATHPKSRLLARAYLLTGRRMPRAHARGALRLSASIIFCIVASGTAAAAPRFTRHSATPGSLPSLT